VRAAADHGLGLPLTITVSPRAPSFGARVGHVVRVHRRKRAGDDDHEEEPSEASAR
jgi:hypothetical protein